MKVFFYSAGVDRTPPFPELYKRVEKELIISNSQQHIDRFKEHKNRLMALVDEESIWFMPEEVKDIFLSWLEEKKYKPEKLTDVTTSKCEILGNEEFNNWFNNSMTVLPEEEYEMVLQPNVQPPEELTTKLELLSKKVTSIKRLAILSVLISAVVAIVGGVFALMKWDAFEKQVNQLTKVSVSEEQLNKGLSSIKPGVSEEQVKRLIDERLPKPKTIVFALVVGDKTVKGKGADRFKELVASSKIADKVEINVHYHARDSEGEILKDLMENKVQLAAPSLSQLDKYGKDIQIFDFPYLFENIEAVNEFQKDKHGGLDLLKTIKKELEKDHLVSLDWWWHGGMKQISANRPLKSPTDVNQEVVFRVQPKQSTPGPILEEQFKKLGAKVEPVPSNKVLEGFKDGKINAQENTWSNSFSEEYYKYQLYFHETDHGYLGYLLLANQEFWNKKLSEPERQALQEILKKVTKDVNGPIVVDVNNKSGEEISKKNTASGEQVEIIGKENLKLDEWCQQMQKAWKGDKNLSGGEMGKYIEIAKKANRAVNKTPSLKCFK